MKYEIEAARYKIFCITEGCINPHGGTKSTHRNVKDFSEESRLAAIRAFETGTKINAVVHTIATQEVWRKTRSGWLCEKCK